MTQWAFSSSASIPARRSGLFSGVGNRIRRRRRLIIPSRAILSLGRRFPSYDQHRQYSRNQWAKAKSSKKQSHLNPLHFNPRFISSSSKIVRSFNYQYYIGSVSKVWIRWFHRRMSFHASFSPRTQSHVSCRSARWEHNPCSDVTARGNRARSRILEHTS